MDYLDLLNQTRVYVENLFHTESSDKLIYHNLAHTNDVVRYSAAISTHYKLNDEDNFIVQCAAWFHDIGYFLDPRQHEQAGADQAVNFLRSLHVEEQVIEKVQGCILATKMPQRPTTLLEEIVCDADLFHLGGETFKEKNKTMRKEAEALCSFKIDKYTWNRKTVSLFKAHHFHTKYCRELLDHGKAENLKYLENMLRKESDKSPSSGSEQRIAEVEPKQLKKKNSDKPERGVETMFRVASTNHQRLSDMADNKAHIMISTNSIILSVLLSLMLRRLEDSPHLIFPTMLLMVVSVVTMVFSILATRPSIPSGLFTPENIKERKTNLLFFGNFYKMGLPEYEMGMREMMEDRDFLYGSLIKDIYSQGKVLGRKYQLLRIAYNVFMFGIVISVIAFIISSIWAVM